MCVGKKKKRKRMIRQMLNWNTYVVLAYNVLRLCVRLRSVGIERSGSLHKTAVIRWHG